MKKVSNIFTNIVLLSLLLFASCKKEDTTPPATTGGVSVNIKIVQKSTGAIVPDNKITNWVINASLWSDGGALLKTQTFNSSQFIFSNLVPANYKITANGTLTLNGVTYSLTGGISGGQVAAGTTVPGAEMTFYY